MGNAVLLQDRSQKRLNTVGPATTEMKNYSFLGRISIKKKEQINERETPVASLILMRGQSPGEKEETSAE